MYYVMYKNNDYVTINKYVQKKNEARLTNYGN